MYLRSLLLSASLLCLIHGGRAEPKFSISVPAKLTSGEEATLCMVIIDLLEELDIDIFLDIGSENITIFSTEIPAGNYDECTTFQTPQLKSAAPVFVMLDAIGSSTIFQDRKCVVIDIPQTITLIQMDKNIYNPGDTVRCRLISVTEDLRWKEESFKEAFMKGPTGSRMYQWLNNNEHFNKFRGLENFEFRLPMDTMTGSHTIEMVKECGEPVYQTFIVDSFALPRFCMEVNAPKVISMMDKSMTYSVFAKYTYGLGVPGKLSGRLCRQYDSNYETTSNRNPDAICTPITEELGSDGQFNGTMDLSPFQMHGSGLEQNLKLQIAMIEEGTGIKVIDTQFIQLLSQAASVSFIPYGERFFYMPGIPLAGKAQLVDGVQKPLSNEILELQVNGLTVQNLTTNEAGIAEFEINTTDFALAQVSLQVNYRNPGQSSENNGVVPVFVSDYYTINRFYSRSRSYIQLWGPTEELSYGQTFSIRVQYALSASGLKDGQSKNNFYYMVMSKSKIIQSGKHEVDLSATLNGEFSISLTASVYPAYDPRVLVYSLLQEETIVDTVQLKMEKCLRDEISVSFSPDRGTPGSKVDLSLTAFSRGMCAVSIIDSSLALLSQYKRLSPDMIYNTMQNADLRGYNVAGFNVEEAPPPCKNNIGDLFYNGSYYQEVSYPGEGDSYQKLRDAGVVFLTNTNLRKPEMCNSGYNPYNPYGPFYETKLLMNKRRFKRGNSEKNLAPIETIRKIFPDVWKFYFVPINEDSSGSDTLVVPDTITNWQADVYCMGPESQFGMTKYPVNFNSFQPFSVTMNMPKAAIREETMEVKVFVDNRLRFNIKIHVILVECDKFTAELEEGEQDMCVPAGKRGSYAWKVKPISQGILDVSVTAETTHIGTSCDGPSDPNQPQRKHTVIQPVIVEDKGIQKELTHSELFCVEDGSIVIPASIALQPNAVDGSSRASITVTGNILSFAVDDPGALIRMPTCCGEQTLATIMHLPSLLFYLESTNQLNDKINQSAKAAMLEGYINMLKFQNSDGGFSAFSGTYQTSSTWLTALTYRSLYQIKKHIFVDDCVLTRALMFLESSQDLVTGGFRNRGTLFNNNLKGGADNDIILSAYIVDTLLQSSYNERETLLSCALDYLVASASRDDLSLYNMAMLYCALSEAKLDAGETVFAKLMEKAVSKDGKLYWEQLKKPKSNSNSFFYAPSSSANIELTGYVLMCMAKKPSPSQSDINTMTRIVLWLMEQINCLGAFHSTTDSAVVLEALAYYSKLTYKENACNQVKVTKGSEVVAEFSVEQNERLLVQRKPLPTVPGDYSITVSGKGCALVQTTMKFNVPVPDEDSAFSLTANTPSESCVNGVAYTFPVNVSLSYNGDRNQTNMVLVKTKPPSGYMLSYQSQMQLKAQFLKVEEKNQMFYIYIDSVSSKTVSMQFEFEMTSRVLNLQPTFVQAEDYYKLDDVGSTVLYHPCNIP